MRVLSFSSCFPSAADPHRGVFVLERLAALAGRVPLEVVHPVGWFPGYPGRFRAPDRPRETLRGLTVHHRRFFYLPGVLKRLDGRLYSRGIARWLGRHFDAHGPPDLLDAHFVWPDGVAVSRLAERFNLPFVVTLRGTLNSRARRRSLRRRIGRALQRAAAVISVGEPMAALAAELGAEPEKITVIPNGVNTNLFRPIPCQLARQSVGLDPAGRCVVAVANMRPDKGLSELVEAMAALPADVRVVIVGEDGDAGGYRRSLQAAARRGGYGDRLLFAGPQPHERVGLYLNAAEVSVLPSRVEGCPNVVLESLACGRPVVATRVGEVPNLVIPDVSGKIVPPRDPLALGDALNAALARTWSAETIRRTPAVRSWDEVAQATLLVWQRAVGEGP